MLSEFVRQVLRTRRSERKRYVLWKKKRFHTLSTPCICYARHAYDKKSPRRESD